jgi:DUF1680 family protein
MAIAIALLAGGACGAASTARSIVSQESRMPTNAGVIASEKLKLKPIPVSAVKMGDGFWKARMDANHERGLPALLKRLEDHGVIDNFMLASGRKKVERKGPYFSDSDLFKWMEGAAWDLISYPDPKRKAQLNRVIDEVVAAQQPDGYLNTFFQGELANQRFRNLPLEHELYCAGHLFQAAVAHHRATGEDKLLECACRYADYLTTAFGPGKRQETDGHPEIEMALVEIYRATGKREYLNLAGFYLSTLEPEYGPKLKGHAVRALYTLCGEADYYAETGREVSKEIIDRQWKDLVSTKMYVTGGVGARGQGEAIGEPYELPNEQAYSETCAAIASVMFNYRMLAVHGESKYADEMERALYNGMLAGVSLSGDAWFYVNPLAEHGGRQRQEWWGCTCCPTNMVRMLASLPGYMYSVSDEGVWVHLFDDSKVTYHLADGTPFTLKQKTKYPWDGSVEITVGLDAPKEFTVFIRRPSWSSPSFVVGFDGLKLGEACRSNGYEAIRRTWKPGDVIKVEMDMSARLIECDPRVRENLGSVAVQRGPVVYCAESVDNPTAVIRDLEIASNEFESVFDAGTLGGVVKLTGRGRTPMDPNGDRAPLYRQLGRALGEDYARMHQVPLVLIPYYAWANRGPSQMTVWMPYRQ